MPQPEKPLEEEFFGEPEAFKGVVSLVLGTCSAVGGGWRALGFNFEAL